MVAVVGAPAQGQLGEVPGAHHQAAALVGDVHEDLGPLPGLPVLKGHVVLAHGLADVLEVAADRLSDVDAPEGGPQALGQLHGVVPGAVSGAEAGHGDGDDVAGRAFHQVHGHAGDEDGKGGVQPAGEPHHGGSGPAVLPMRFLRPRAARRRISSQWFFRSTAFSGMKGRGLTCRVRRVSSTGKEKGSRRIRPRPSGGEGGQAAALIGQALHVDLADCQPRGKAPLGQQGAVFGHQVVPSKDQVGGGLPLPGVGVDIAAHQRPTVPPPGSGGTPPCPPAHRMPRGSGSPWPRPGPAPRRVARRPTGPRRSPPPGPGRASPGRGRGPGCSPVPCARTARPQTPRPALRKTAGLIKLP